MKPYKWNPKWNPHERVKYQHLANTMQHERSWTFEVPTSSKYYTKWEVDVPKNIATTLQNGRWTCHKVANTMQNDRFCFQTIANTMQLVPGKKSRRLIKTNLRLFFTVFTHSQTNHVLLSNPHVSTARGPSCGVMSVIHLNHLSI